MAHVSVTIDGRQYRMACEDGQETHLMGLAEDLDRRIEGLRRRFGEIGDTRLIVMAALTVADELVEIGQRLRQTEAELATLRDTRSASVEHSQVAEAAIASSLHAAAERIERVTKTLDQSLGEEAALG